LQHAEAIVCQPQIADDFLAKQAVDVRGRGNLEAGKSFLGDAAAADERPPLQHEHLPPGASKIAGGHQPIVAGTDDDGVVTHANRNPSGYLAPASERREQSPLPHRREGNGYYRFTPLPGVTTPPRPSDSGWRAILSANSSRSFIARSSRGMICFIMQVISVRVL